MRDRRIPYLLQVLGVGLAYVVGARLGQFTAIPPGDVGALWAPAGISVAAVALAGVRVWPGIWLGAFIYNFAFFHGGGAADPSVAMGVSVGIATGSTLMAVVGRYLVRLGQGPAPALDSPRDALLWTLGAGVLAATISASIGTTILAGGNLLPLPAPIVWRTWWLGDATGIVLIAPVAILWDRHGALRARVGQETETLLAALAFAVICFVVFGTTAPRTAAPYLLAVPVLFLSYTAFRFGRRITASTALALAIVAGIATASGKGPLHAAEFPDALFALQAFLAIGATLGLTLACGVAQSRRGTEGPGAVAPTDTGLFPIAELVAFRRTAVATTADRDPAAPMSSRLTDPAPELDAVLAALPEPLYVLTRRSLSVSHCNVAFALALGRAGRAEVEGRSLFDLFPPAVALHAADEARWVFHTGEARESREQWPGGAPGPTAFDVTRTPVFDADGAIDGLLARARPSGAR
jgi:integral membrane sensor domain MASE1